VLLEQHGRDVGHAHRHARVSRVGRLHGVHRQHAERRGLGPVIGVFWAQRSTLDTSPGGEFKLPRADFMGGIKPALQPIGPKPDEISVASAKLVTNLTGDDSRRTGRDGGSLSTPEISELERRIASAIDRMGAAVAALSPGGVPDLSEALAAEREANAQLEARVAAIKERQETKVAGLESEVRQLRTALVDRDAQLQRMREVNAGLRESNAALREANAAGLADAALVNSAMEVEVAALRETADARRAEIDEVLARLEPLIEERDHA
jgi:hypothetical protein